LAERQPSILRARVNWDITVDLIIIKVISEIHLQECHVARETFYQGFKAFLCDIVVIQIQSLKMAVGLESGPDRNCSVVADFTAG
jgi:hypothetical protein